MRDEREQFIPEQLRDIGQVISDTFEYLRIAWPDVWRPVLYFVVPLSAVLGYVDYMLFQAPQAPFDGYNFWLSPKLSMLASILFATIVGQHMHLTQQHGNRSFSFQEVTRGLFFNFLGACIILIIFLLPVVPTSVALFGIYLAARLGFTWQARLAGHKNVIKAFSESWFVSSGSGFQIIGLFLLMGVVVLFFALCLILARSLTMELLSSVLGGELMSDEALGGAFENQIFGSLTNLSTGPFFVAVSLMYYSSREKRYGYHLSSLVEQLAPAATTDEEA